MSARRDRTQNVLALIAALVAACAWPARADGQVKVSLQLGAKPTGRPWVLMRRGTTLFVAASGSQPVTIELAQRDAGSASGGRVRFRHGPRSAETLSVTTRGGARNTATVMVRGESLSAFAGDVVLTAALEGTTVARLPVSVVRRRPDLGKLLPSSNAALTALNDHAVAFTQMRHHQSQGLTTVEASLTNRSARASSAELLLIFEAISDTTITVNNADGFDASGKPYVDFSGQIPGGRLKPNTSTGRRTIAFHNPNGVNFKVRARVVKPQATSTLASTRERKTGNRSPADDKSPTRPDVTQPQAAKRDEVQAEARSASVGGPDQQPQGAGDQPDAAGVAAPSSLPARPAVMRSSGTGPSLVGLVHQRRRHIPSSSVLPKQRSGRPNPAPVTRPVVNEPLGDDPAVDHPVLDENGLLTRGSIATGALQIGSWSPVDGAPPWVFPMVQITWPTRADRQVTVEQYAKWHVKEVNSRPPDQPIWLVTQGWLGNYMPGRDEHHYMVHRDDSTPQGTPGIWPVAGTAIWKPRQQRFVGYLKDAECRLDAWLLDNETRPSPGGQSYSQTYAFANIVNDPRWRDPLPHLGFRGIDLLDPVRLLDELPWARLVSSRAGRFSLRDSELAVRHVAQVGSIIRNRVLDDIFTPPATQAYPHLLVTNYDSTVYLVDLHGPPQKLRWSIRDNIDIWRRIVELNPSIDRIPGVGNVANPPLYGFRTSKRQEDPVPIMLEEVDRLIGLYSGPEKVIPNVPDPQMRFWDKPHQRRFSPQQYRRLILGLVQRGIRRMALFNSTGEHRGAAQITAATEEMLAVFNEAYQVAESLAANGAPATGPDGQERSSYD